MRNDAYKQYLTQEVMTASPEKLVYMLYDKAITSLKEAIRAIEAGDINKRCMANKKACEIITHMWQTLDMEKGGEISANLDRLYSFILNGLPQVDFKNDPKPAQDAINLLAPLHESWKQLAMNNPQKQATPPQDSTPTDPPAEPPSEDGDTPPTVPTGGVSVSA